MISATVRFIGNGIDPHRKIGVIARNELQQTRLWRLRAWRWTYFATVQARRYCQTQISFAAAGGYRKSEKYFCFLFPQPPGRKNYKTAWKELAE
jgi:hypothetical protein